RHPGSRLAILLPPERRLHERADLVGEEAGVLVEAGQLLAIALGQLGLVVPGIDLAGTAIDEQPDGRAGRAGEVTRPRGERAEGPAVRGGRDARGEQPLLLEQARQRQHAEADAAAPQKRTARGIERRRSGEELGESHGDLVDFLSPFSREPPASVKLALAGG